jgi:hypothetical protein
MRMDRKASNFLLSFMQSVSFAGSNPAEDRKFLRAIKIRTKTSFQGEMKRVPRRKILRHVKNSYSMKDIFVGKIQNSLTFLSQFLLLRYLVSRVEPCRLLGVYRRFRDAYCLYYHRPDGDYAFLKRRSTPRRPKGSTSQKTLNFIPAAVRTWILTIWQSLVTETNFCSWYRIKFRWKVGRLGSGEKGEGVEISLHGLQPWRGEALRESLWSWQKSRQWASGPMAVH